MGKIGSEFLDVGVNEYSSPNDPVLQTKVTGDAYPRLRMRADGTILTGDGTTSPSSLISSAPIVLASGYGASTAATAAANKTAIDNALAAAVAAGGGIVLLPGGTNTAPLLTDGGHDIGVGVEVWGAGSSTATCVLNRGATYCFRLKGEGSGQQSGSLRRVQIVGADGGHAAVNGGIGVEIANGLGATLEDVFVGGFTGSGSVGVRFHNIAGTAQFVEQTDLRHLFITNCTTLMQFLSDAGVGTSFGYTKMEALGLEIQANQVGIDVGGAGPGTANLYNSRIEGEAHFNGNNAIGLLVTTHGELTDGMSLDIRGENDGGTGQVRIKNQGTLFASGQFFVATTQPADDLSAVIAHEFQEWNQTSAELASASRSIAAAWPLIVPGGSDVWLVTGNNGGNGLHSFGTQWEGRRFTLIFVDGLTVHQNTGFIELAGGVDFVAAAKASITFAMHGATAYEVGRKT